jgi:hypothetical protein
VRRLLFALALLVGVAPLTGAAPKKRPHSKSPHAEISAVAVVETPPQRILHRNGRSFEELDVKILSADRVPRDGAGGDEGLPIDKLHRVHVVHDLTCGGNWVDAKRGDRLEIKGEYVHPPSGADLIHFTHPADGSCPGRAGHPDGYLRLARTASAPPLETPDLFRTAVRPVLAKNCMCHEKGEKMYAKLPFDDPSVLSSHTAGVRKRLKGDDLALFERWLGTVSESPAPQATMTDR